MNAYLGAGAVTANSGSTAIAGTVGASTVSIGGGTLTLSTGGRLSNSAAVTLSSGGLNLGGNETVSTYTQSGGTLAGSGTLTAASYSVSGGTLSATLGGTGTVAMTGGGFLATPGQTTANAVTIGSSSQTTTAFSGYWNFGTTSPGSAAATTVTGSGVSFGSVSQGNNNGTTTLLDTTSASSGYSGASGSYNAGAAARTGGLNTASSAYFEFTLTGSAGYTFNVSNVSLGSRSTGTGPTAVDLRANTASNYATVLGGTTVSANSTWALQSITVAGTTSSGAVIYRIYGSGGSGSPTAGTANWRIDDLTVSGTSFSSSSVSATAQLGIGSAGATTYSGPVAVTGTAELTAVAGGTATFSGVISGTSGFVIKTGAGTVILNGSNTYAAGTSITAGTLKTGNASSFGSGSVTLSASSTLDLNALAIANAITNNGGTLANAASYTGTQSLTAAASFGALGGTLSVINGGTATLTSAMTGTVSVAAGGQANLNDGASLSQSTLANNGLVTVNQSGNTTLSTAITGSGAFQKLGSGILTVSGNNTYSGATTVSAGGLKVDGSIGSGGLSVAAAAWLMGTGTINGPVTISGTLSPGASPGVITLGSLVLTDASTTVIDIASAGTRGSAYDGVSILDPSGLTYGGTVSFAFGGSAIANDTTFDIFSFTGSSAGSLAAIESTGFYAGTWTPLGSGTFQLVSGTQTLTFSQTTGDVIVVPEPAAIALAGLALGAGSIALLRRRRA